jgi:quercetin dioxygenase-like cupin family protein
MGLKHATPGEIVNVFSLKTTLERAKAVTLVKTNSFETICMRVDANHEIPEHKAKGPITLQCLDGKIYFTVNQKEHEMSAGDWLYLEKGQLHSLKGIENSVLLLTVIFPGKIDDHK